MVVSHRVHHNKYAQQARAAQSGQQGRRDETSSGDSVEIGRGRTSHSGRRRHDGSDPKSSDKLGNIPRESIQAGAPFPDPGNGLVGIDILHFNDFHRQLDPARNGLGGAARMAGLTEKVRQELPGSILVNMGDLAYGDGGPIAGMRSFEPIPAMFNEMKVDLLELGNHEFQDCNNDYEALQKGLIAKFNGEVLCANISQDGGGTALNGIKPYSIKQLQGMNVAFIGIVTRDLATKAHPLVGAGLTVANLDQTLQKLIPEVRAKGADAVVVLAHESFNDCVNIASRVPGIDAILAAHDHKQSPDAAEVTAPDGRTTLVTEAGSHGAFLGHMRIVMDPSKRSVVRVEDRLIPVDKNAPADPEVQAIVDAYDGKR